jgi:hypothetical protein
MAKLVDVWIFDWDKYSPENATVFSQGQHSSRLS